MEIPDQKARLLQNGALNVQASNPDCLLTALEKETFIWRA